jgi:ABC-type transport system substrate-binding protein
MKSSTRNVTEGSRSKKQGIGRTYELSCGVPDDVTGSCQPNILIAPPGGPSTRASAAPDQCGGRRSCAPGFSSITNQHGPRGQQQQVGEWTNEEFNRLSEELGTSTDRGRRRAVFRRLLEIAEREDPAYTVLHQTATLTAKRKDIRWKAAQSFLMDFRARNLAFPA